MQLLVHSSGAAGALGLYQLDRRGLTIETIHSNFAAAGAVLRCSHAPANHFATCKWCTDTVPARTSSLTSEMCVVKCFCGRSSTNSVGMSSANKMFQLTGQAATTHTITITKPNLTAHSLPCTHLHPFGYKPPSVAACGATPQACSLFPADHTAATLPFRVQSAQSCFTINCQSSRDRQCSVAACCLLCQSSIIN